MPSSDLALLALGVLAFALVSRRAESGVVTAPMAFALFGFLVGPAALDLIAMSPGTGFVDGLAEVTLVLVLFTDASRIEVLRLDRQHALPIRMLGIGLPLSVAAGMGLGALLFPDLGLWQASLLGAILAPTDAALGQAVMNNRSVPARVRQALNVESGLNDGLAFPAVLVFLSLAGGAAAREPAEWAFFVTGQLILGPLIGLAVGFAGAWAVQRSADQGWMNRTFLQISVLSLALLAYGTAELAGGNGFIAAFTAGLLVGTRSRALKKPLEDFGETEGHLLTLVVFFLFGVTLLPDGVGAIGWREALYAVLSLTVVRMIPVALSLLGYGLAPATVLFLGWFGPRGLASIIYLLIVLEHDEGVGEAVLPAVALTVALSILAHGVTASPAAKAYGRRAQRLSDDAPENRDVHPFPTRPPSARQEDGASRR